MIWSNNSVESIMAPGFSLTDWFQVERQVKTSNSDLWPLNMIRIQVTLLNHNLINHNDLPSHESDGLTLNINILSGVRNRHSCVSLLFSLTVSLHLHWSVVSLWPWLLPAVVWGTAVWQLWWGQTNRTSSFTVSVEQQLWGHVTPISWASSHSTPLWAHFLRRSMTRYCSIVRRLLSRVSKEDGVIQERDSVDRESCHRGESVTWPITWVQQITDQ